MLIFFGIFLGLFIFEPILINLVYFSNIALFEDIILFKKNKKKIRDYYYKVFLNEKR